MNSAELEALLDEIRNGRGEDHALELKEKWWDLGVPKSREEFVKDVTAMANANTKDPKVILVGVDQAGKVRHSPLPEDEANLQQRLQVITPVPHVVFRAITLPGESTIVTAIEIHEPFDKPYVVKDGARHTIWVRQGSSTATATRGMLDRWYEARENLSELRLLVDEQDVGADPAVEIFKPYYVAAETDAATYPIILASRSLRSLDPMNSLDRVISGRPRGKEAFMGRFKSDPVEDADFMNREHRLRMVVENFGSGSAQNVTVDFELAPAERIRVEMPGPKTRPRVWETDDGADSRIEEGEARVRQRIRQLNPKTCEPLHPISIVLPQGHVRLNYQVSYRITDSKGLRLEGKFWVEVEWDSEEVLEAEERFPF